MNLVTSRPDTQTVVLKPRFPPPSTAEVVSSDFYKILHSLVGGRQCTDDTYSDGASSLLPPGRKATGRIDGMSAPPPPPPPPPPLHPPPLLVHARGTPHSSHQQVHHLPGGRGTHLYTPQSTPSPLHHPSPLYQSRLHPSHPLSGGVSRAQRPFGGVPRNADDVTDQSLPWSGRHVMADKATPSLPPLSKGALCVQPCLEPSQPPSTVTASEHGQKLCGRNAHSCVGSPLGKGSSSSSKVVSVLELGPKELQGVGQLLGAAREVVMAVVTRGRSSVGPLRGAVGPLRGAAGPLRGAVGPLRGAAGPLRGAVQVVEGIHIAVPSQREGAVVTPVQREGAMVAPVQRAGAMVAHCWFIPLEHCTPELYTWCKSQLLSLLGNSKVICYNGQQIARALLDHYQLATSTEWVHWTFLDTLVGSWLLDPDHPPQTLSEALTRVGLKDLSDEGPGSGGDVALLVPLMEKLCWMLQKEELWELFITVEVKLIPILAAMEVFGVEVNCCKLFQFADALKAKISKVESEVHKAAGHTFSVNSTAQLRQVLFDELHLEERSGHILNKTQVHGFTSTSEEVLMQLQQFHPLPKLVLEYRQLCKLHAAFIQGTITYVSEGVIRPCWQHTGTATGRLTSTNPNIQAFPRDALDLGVVGEQYIVGKAQQQMTINVREMVQSRTGFTFLAADFRSIELRLIAHLSGDQRLIAMLASDGRGTTDVFTLLTSEWLGIPPGSAESTDRERTKRVVYAVIYGVGKEKLGGMLKIPADHAKALVDSFLARFPAIKTYINDVISCCKKGNVPTICKRKRWFPHINSANPNLRAHSERQAINFPIQGSAADICKCAMIHLVHMLAGRSPRTRLLIQIHDELVFEVPDDELHAISGLVKMGLETPPLPSAGQLKVPLEVRLMAGKNWAAMSEVKDHTV